MIILYTDVVRPTPVQWACIPPALQGRDVIGSAKTGSGKTIAFVLPILNKLSSDPYGIFALVLTPTRELAFQVRCSLLYHFPLLMNPKYTCY